MTRRYYKWVEEDIENMVSRLPIPEPGGEKFKTCSLSLPPSELSVQSSAGVAERTCDD